MSTPLTPNAYQRLKRAWKNFDTMVSMLPLSEISALLAFYSQNVLEKLEVPAMDYDALEVITQRVRHLVAVSPVALGIDDVVDSLQDALDIETSSCAK